MGNWQSVIVVGAAVLLIAVLGFTIALYRRGGRSASAVEEELRRRIAELGVREDDLRRRLDEEEHRRIEAETRLEEERRRLQEHRALLEEAELRFKDAFRALSADALKANREEFLGQAKERLEGVQRMMENYQKKLDDIEEARNKAYGGIEEHIRSLTSAQQGLLRETHTLSTALRSPTVRGRWGEVTLRNVVELAGMSRHCDFEEQVTRDGEDGRLRPDLVVRLPNNRVIVVDSKVPLEAYLEALECDSEAQRTTFLERHAKAVRDRVRQLGQKGYAAHLDTTPDFVVLFLPGESFFSAALEHDRALIEDGMRNGVILATPTTLIALLKAVAYGWQQQELTENARQVAEAGRDLYDRICVFAEHLGKVGKGLRTATDAYNQAVGSYELRLRPGARSLADLGATTSRTLPEGEPVEAALRSTSSDPPTESD